MINRWFFRIYDGSRYITLFGSENYDAICDGNRYLTSLKNGIPYIFSDNFLKIEADSYNTLLLEKKLTLLDVLINIKLVLDKNKNNTTIRFLWKNACIS